MPNSEELHRASQPRDPFQRCLRTLLPIVSYRSFSRFAFVPWFTPLGDVAAPAPTRAATAATMELRLLAFAFCSVWPYCPGARSLAAQDPDTTRGLAALALKITCSRAKSTPYGRDFVGYARPRELPGTSLASTDRHHTGRSSDFARLLTDPTGSGRSARRSPTPHRHQPALCSPRPSGPLYRDE